MRMELGVCAGLDLLPTIDELGFDFIEVNATTLSQLSDDEFSAALLEYQRYRIPVRSSNCFFPGTLRLVGADRDIDQLQHYIDHTMKRMKDLGVEVMVLGSGASRCFPPDMTYRQAFAQLVELCRMIAASADVYDLKVVIEPLNRKETNIINSVAEAAVFAAAVDHPRIGVLADLYHIMTDGEPLNDLKRLAPLDHIHIATADRLVPTTREDIIPIISILRDIDYQGRVSIEASSEQFREDAALALAHFRALTSPDLVVIN